MTQRVHIAALTGDGTAMVTARLRRADSQRDGRLPVLRRGRIDSAARSWRQRRQRDGAAQSHDAGTSSAGPLIQETAMPAEAPHALHADYIRGHIRTVPD